MRRVRDLRLGTRIALTTFAFGAIVGLALTLVFSLYARRGVLSLAESALEEQAHHTSHFVDELLLSRMALAKTIAAIGSLEASTSASNAEMSSVSEAIRLARIAELDARWRGTESPVDPFIAQYLENEVAQELRRQISVHPGVYGEIFLTDRYGALIASTGKLTTLAHGHKNWWQAAYSEGQGATFIDDRGYDASVGDYVLGIVVPIMVDGQVSGVLKCNFSILESLGEALSDAERVEGAAVLLARSNGLIVSGPGYLPLQNALSEETVVALSGNTAGWLTVQEEGETFLSAFAEVSYTSRSTSESFGGTFESIDHSFGNTGESWFVVVKQNMEQVLAPSSVAITQLVLIALGAIVSMVGVSLFIGWRVAKPAGRLELQVRAFSSQSLDHRVSVEADDEIGRLAQSFNEVAAQLESSVVSRDKLAEEVSRRELVESVLRESEKKYRQLFENMVNGFALHEMVLDQDGKPVDYIFLDVNSAFERLVGQGRESLLGKRVTEVLPGIEQDPANWIGKYAEVASGGSEISFEQYSEVLGKWFSVLAYTPREGQFATIFEDISARKRMASERQAVEAHLRQSQKLESMGTLASGVAHEINNPLMGILNYAELVKDRVQDEKSLDYLTEIGIEGNRITTIVKNLLSFSRQERQNVESADIGDIVERSFSLIGATMRRDQIMVETDIPEDLPKVECHDQQIQQVIINLLTNAHDALNERYPGFDENKIIRVNANSFEKNGEAWIRTTIEDHGPGVSADLAERIFDPFFSTKPKNEGTGLGLSVSFGILKEHGGELIVESNPGEYARFHMDLPISQNWTKDDDDKEDTA
jgi:PAS domain S-box-containing protein